MSDAPTGGQARVRASVKQRSRRGDQIRRRELLMAKQRRARRDMLSHARCLVEESHDEPAPTPAPASAVPESATRAAPSPQSRGSALAAYWRRFMCPEWLIDVPPDLCGGWVVMPRPEGRRCLVVASHGRCVARDQNGRRVATWRSALPGGGGAGGSHGFTVLDCIDGHDEHGACTFVLDLVAWDGNLYYDCEADFRMFWRNSKLAEVRADTWARGRNERRLVPVPHAECDAASLRLAYGGTFPFERDGLLFFAKACHYTPGVSPGVLQFRDRATSRWFCASHATATFQTTDDGHVVSVDDEPQVVCSLAPDTAASLGVTPGGFVKVQLVCTGDAERAREAAAAGADMQRATTRVAELREYITAQRAMRADTRAAERDLRGWKSQIEQLEAVAARRAHVATGELPSQPLDVDALPPCVIAVTARGSRWRWFGDSWTRLVFMAQLTQGVLSFESIVHAAEEQATAAMPS